jgi:hypothetical protein
VKQLGIDYTMTEITAIVGRALDRDVDYRFVDMGDREAETVFRERFGTLERWVYDKATMAALNDGRVRFAMIVRRCARRWKSSSGTPSSLVEKARTDGVKPETFLTWSSQR